MTWPACAPRWEAVWPIQSRRKSASRHRLGGGGSEAFIDGLALVGARARQERRTAQGVLESLRGCPSGQGKVRCAAVRMQHAVTGQE
ncbi:hypothetical protein GCM10010404_03820 [Nonomuraea africana]